MDVSLACIAYNDTIMYLVTELACRRGDRRVQVSYIAYVRSDYKMRAGVQWCEFKRM